MQSKFANKLWQLFLRSSYWRFSRHEVGTLRVDALELTMSNYYAGKIELRNLSS